MLSSFFTLLIAMFFGIGGFTLGRKYRIIKYPLNRVIDARERRESDIVDDLRDIVRPAPTRVISPSARQRSRDFTNALNS